MGTRGERIDLDALALKTGGTESLYHVFCISCAKGNPVSLSTHRSMPSPSTLTN